MNPRPSFLKSWLIQFLAAGLGLLSLGPARAQIYILSRNTGAVSEYQRDGTVVKPALIPPSNGPSAFALAGSNLVVADDVKEAILQYSNSGQTTNPLLISGISPTAVAVSGSNIFVASARKGTIGEYTLDGKVVNAALLSGLKGPVGIAVSGANLFVAQAADGTIGKYTLDGKTVNAALISGLHGFFGLAVSGSAIYVTNGTGGTIDQYDTDGKLVKAALIPRLQSPLAIAISGGNLYVTSNANGGTVGVYATSGKIINSALITGIAVPTSIAIVDSGPEPVTVVRASDTFDPSKPPPFPKLPPQPRINLPAVIVDSAGYGTENNWLAHHIALRIATLCYLALHPDAKTVPDFKISARVDAQAQTVHLKLENFAASPITADLKPDFAWDPAGYAPFATQLLGSNAPALAPPPDSGPDLLIELLTLTGPELAKADMRLSAQLAKNPAWSTGHEQAALLLVGLALRDRASTFTDYRQILCRATAHLAVAQALRQTQEATWTGDIADAGIRTLSGREADALAHLTTLTANDTLPDAAKIWVSALRVRATGDWRPVPVTKDTPLLEKIVLAHVMHDELTSLGAEQRLTAAGSLELVPDWGRCALTNRVQTSVETGNTYGPQIIPLELKELNEILYFEKAPALDPNDVGATFAQPLQETVLSGQPPTLHIIGPAMFTDVTRRHILGEIQTTNYWLTNMLGDPQGAQSYVARSQKLFSDARMVELLNFSDPHMLYVKIFTALHDAQRQWEPWEMPMGVIPDCYQLIYPDTHTIHAFYADGLPFGTAYELDYRQGSLSNASLLEEDKHPEVYFNPSPGFDNKTVGKALLNLAPDSLDALDIYGVSPPDYLQRTKPLWDYNLAPIFKLEGPWSGVLHPKRMMLYSTGAPDPTPAPENADFLLLMQKHAALDPGAYFQLGAALREDGNPDEAAEADRKGFDQGLDQVAMSNSVGPLVEYYHQHGRDDEAEMVAKRAAEVYSEQGLLTYMNLLEELGRFDEADTCGKNIRERYGSSNQLLHLYASHPSQFPTQHTASLVFPDGRVKSDLNSLPPGPPTYGARFISDNDKLAVARLRVGDIVVALDSYRVSNTDQLIYLSAASTDPNMEFIVWRKDRYLTIHATVPGRKFGGVSVQTVKP